MTADSFGAFTEAGGPYDKKVAERLRKYIFSVGNTIDPAEGYRNFRGRDPKVEGLIKKREFSSYNALTTSAKGGSHDCRLFLPVDHAPFRKPRSNFQIISKFSSSTTAP